MKKLTKTVAAHKIVTGCIIFLILVGTATLLTAGKEEKKAERAYLGVSMDNLSPSDKDEFGVKFGILVTGVAKDEAAEKAGIKKYDIIQFFNDEKMRRPEDLRDAIAKLTPGAKGVVKLVRDGKELTITATLGKTEDRPMIYFDNGKGVPPQMVFPKGDKGNHMFFESRGGAFLGVNLHEFSDDLAGYFGVKRDGGVLIISVEKDSPAQKAGLKDGDVILQIDGKNMDNAEAVADAIAKKEKGNTVEIQIMRHNKKETIKAELGERNLDNIFHIFKNGDEKEIDINIPKIHIEKMKLDKLHHNTWDLKRIDEKVRVQLEKCGEQLEKCGEQLEKKLENAEKVVYKVVKKIKQSGSSI